MYQLVVNFYRTVTFYCRLVTNYTDLKRNLYHRAIAATNLVIKAITNTVQLNIVTTKFFFITAVFECIFFPIVQGGRRLSNRDEPIPIDCTDIPGASCAWGCQPGEEEVSDSDLCSGYSGFWGWKKCCAPIYGQTQIYIICIVCCTANCFGMILRKIRGIPKIVITMKNQFELASNLKAKYIIKSESFLEPEPEPPAPAQPIFILWCHQIKRASCQWSCDSGSYRVDAFCGNRWSCCVGSSFESPIYGRSK